MLLTVAFSARQSQDAFTNLKNQRGETLMKSTLIRILTIATLATSISAFAATSETKSDAAAKTSAPQQQAGCADRAGEGKKPKKATPQQDQNDKDYGRALLGIYG
jgi:hypothetical protein